MQTCCPRGLLLKELQVALKEKGLDTKGKKAELKARLAAAEGPNPVVVGGIDASFTHTAAEASPAPGGADATVVSHASALEPSLEKMEELMKRAQNVQEVRFRVD